jgi:RecB family exonuclease
MALINYLVGRSVDARQRLLADKISSRQYGFILYLVPTRGRVMELEADSRSWLKKRIDTLAGIVQRIFEEDIRHKHFKGHRPVDDALISMLMKMALEKRIRKPGGLIYFNRLFDDNKWIEFPGIYGAIAGFFTQLIKDNYQDFFNHDPAERVFNLGDRGQEAGEDRYAMERDLLWLLEDYKEIKRDIRVYDKDDIISSVKAFLHDGGSPSFMAGSDVIVFDGFVNISRIEEDILFHLFSLVREVWWLIDYYSGPEDPIKEFKRSTGRQASELFNDRGLESGPDRGVKEACRIFGSLVSLMDRLEEAGIEYIVEKAEDKAFLNPVAGGLYWNGQMDETAIDNLKIRSFGRRVDEVRAIAAEIKRIIHEDNLDMSSDLGRIRIIFPDLNDYSSLIFEIFSEYGLPFSLTKGLPLSSHPISAIFIHIFKISMNHFEREDIFNLFSSDLIQANFKKVLKFGDENLGGLEEYLLPGDSISSVKRMLFEDHVDAFSTGFDIFPFDSFARRSRINNLGYDLSGLEKNGLLSVKELLYQELQGLTDEVERGHLRLEYYAFIIRARLLYRILEPFQGLADQDSPQGIARLFSEILSELGLPENIIDMPYYGIRPGPLAGREMIKRDLKAFSLLNELISAGAKEMMIAGELSQPRTGNDLLSGFYSIFRYRLDNTYIFDEPNPNIIRISQWLETRGRSFDYIFAGGLTADRFPLGEEMNFVLTESPGKGIETPDNVDLSRYLFSHLLRNYRRSLYLSYPRHREDKMLQPSQVFMDIHSMVKPESFSGAGIGELETLFKWDDSPYLASSYEMLNAAYEKDGSSAGKYPASFALKDVILTDEGSADGLIRGINAVSSRSALDGLFEYDGLVGGADLFSEFLRRKGDTFSASQMETLANCPMRYLFEYIYGLKRLRDIGPEASPMDMGQYIHKILSLFFKELCKQGKNVSDMGISWSFSKAMGVVRDFSLKNPFLKRFEFFESQEREFLAGLEYAGAGSKGDPKKREGILAMLLRFEESAFSDRIPKGVEYEFGYKRDPALLGRTRLRGYIDRFDLDKKDRERIYIYDYKSGSLPSSNMVKKGLSFQLPVYIRALRSVPGVKKISAAFYSLKKEDLEKEAPVKQSINDHVDQGKGLDISGISLIDDYADRLMDTLERGYFHHSADGAACDYCEFIYACHKDLRRMDHLLESGMGHQIYSGVKNLERWADADQFINRWKDTLEDMQKALTLKTERGRRGRFEAVMNFAKEVMISRDLLPFHSEYIDELLNKIKEFEKRYLSAP